MQCSLPFCCSSTEWKAVYKKLEEIWTRTVRFELLMWFEASLSLILNPPTSTPVLPVWVANSQSYHILSFLLSYHEKVHKLTQTEGYFVSHSYLPAFAGVSWIHICLKNELKVFYHFTQIHLKVTTQLVTVFGVTRICKEPSIIRINVWRVIRISESKVALMAKLNTRTGKFSDTSR
jgi:hypothetical protein